MVLHIQWLSLAGSNEDAAELLKQQWRSQLEPKKVDLIALEQKATLFLE